jgi:hypothetical protein
MNNLLFKLYFGHYFRLKQCKPALMEIPHEMTTLSSVMEKLRVKKIDTEYTWTPEGFTIGSGKFYQPFDLEIVKVYRFEGITDPADMAILYVIQAKDGTIGYSLDSYGVYSNQEGGEGYDNFIRQIPEKGHQEQLLFEI